jgi:thymidylate kinase
MQWYKLFILGLPGSGKSTVSREIIKYVNQTYKNWFVDRCCDYDILYNMFKRDIKRKDFYPVKNGGFYVTNPTKYDIALSKLETDSPSYKQSQYGLQIIEFARGDYLKALNLFQDGFLSNSSFLFLYSDIDTCIQRINQRVKEPHSLDDHFVPERTFERFIKAEPEEYLKNVCTHVQNSYWGQHSRFRIIDSRETLDDTLSQVKPFIDEMITLGTLFHDWETRTVDPRELVLPVVGIH